MNTRHLLRFFTLLLLVSLLIPGISASSPAVETAVEKGLSYLESRQNTDGGFIEPNTGTTSISATWFASQALVAAGEDPLSAKWTKNGKTPLDYLAESPDGKSDGTGEIAKWITFTAACGKDPYTFADYDAVAALQEKIKEDGRVGNYIYTTYWGIFGLTAAGEDVKPQIAWLLTQQNADGSFGSYGTETGDSGDADNTAASIMALRAAGIPADDPAVEAAVQFLREAIEENGGYNYGYYSAPNLASTAWAVQAFCSVGIDPSTVKSSAGNSPVDYLLSLQKEDGSFRYTETLTDTPVGMTARAVAALSGCAYPILPGAQGFDIKGGTVSVTVPEDTLQADKPSVPSGAWEEITVTDGFGYTITISARPERIVSLAPANTEILFAVGAGDRVVAVTEYCTFPEEAATLPVIGGYSTINIERIVAANPDLIFAYHGNGEENINYLKHLGYNVITLNADSIAGTLHDIRLVGEAVGCTETAEKLVSDMEVRLSAVSEKLAGIPESEKPTMVHSMWTDPLWVSGNHTFQNEMIQYAGGINAVVTTEGWGIVTLEKFLLIDPDIIFVDTGMGMGEGAQDVLKNYFLTEPRLSTLTAVQNGHVYAVNADIIDRGGPRLVDGVEAIASIAHPEIFGEYEPDRSTASSPAPVLGIIAGLAAVYLWKRKE